MTVKAALKAALGPILAGSVEGGVYTSLDDAMRQFVTINAGAQEGYDPVQGAIAAGTGAVAGGVLTGAAATALPLVKGAVDAFGRTVKEAAQGNTLFSGVPIPAPEGSRAHKVPHQLLMEGTGEKAVTPVTQGFSPANKQANIQNIDATKQANPGALNSEFGWRLHSRSTPTGYRVCR